MMNLPLKGLVVLEFSQYLSGPSAGLRLADLGAQVIKIERPQGGDAGRKLAIKDMWIDEDSLLFHTINRNKESVVADLKNADDIFFIKHLIKKADVLIHNFRPGIMHKNGLGFEEAKKLNPKLVYAEISGYGKEGPWMNKPGQDLLLQSITGIAHTTGNGNNDPVPFGISIADILCGAQLVQGILAALIRRHKTGTGALIEVSLMESLIDFQFELFTTYYASKKQPQRSNVNNGHPLLSAPYGIYETANGFIALAMMDLPALAKAIHCSALELFLKDDTFSKRDEIKEVLVKHLKSAKTSFWLSQLQEEGLWAMEVFDWEKLVNHEAYRVLRMEQKIKGKASDIITTRCPIRIDGKLLLSEKPAPALGEHTAKYKMAL